MKLLLFFCAFAFSLAAVAQYRFSDSFSIEKGEHWFGAAVDEGTVMPFANGYRLDLYGNNRGNQAAPLLLSTNGRYLWSEQPFAFGISGNQLVVHSMENVTVERGGGTLATAYQHASKNIFRHPENCPIHF